MNEHSSMVGLILPMTTRLQDSNAVGMKLNQPLVSLSTIQLALRMPTRLAGKAAKACAAMRKHPSRSVLEAQPQAKARRRPALVRRSCAI